MAETGHIWETRPSLNSYWPCSALGAVKYLKPTLTRLPRTSTAPSTPREYEQHLQPAPRDTRTKSPGAAGPRTQPARPGQPAGPPGPAATGREARLGPGEAARPDARTFTHLNGGERKKINKSKTRRGPLTTRPHGFALPARHRRWRPAPQQRGTRRSRIPASQPSPTPSSAAVVPAPACPQAARGAQSGEGGPIPPGGRRAAKKMGILAWGGGDLTS